MSEYKNLDQVTEYFKSVTDLPDTDIELIKIFKQSESVRNVIFKRHYKTIVSRIMAHKKKCPMMDVDDLFSAGVDGLLDAIENFDISKSNGAKFGSYAYTYINGYMLNCIKASNDIREYELQTLDQTTSEGDSTFVEKVEDSCDIFQQYQDTETRRIIENAIKSLENDRAKQVIIAYYLQGKTMEEIAETFGCSQQNIHKIKCNAEKNLLIFLTNEGLDRIGEMLSEVKYDKNHQL